MQARATETVGDCKPKDVATLMWSLAKMDITPDAGLLLSSLLLSSLELSDATIYEP